MFVEIPAHIAVSDFVRRVKGRSLHQVLLTTSGNITDDVILQYLQKHEPTGASR